ncbi:hypothetical protein DFA_06013 [Cavenderia fasciculata]|uniref:Uncharacterized protein n=1 Tax=Cavenderia fasciculata TaxID=261658 RepID=F4PJV1_CACFS|nr:uncharacterized protein DFA_06013 [Cavenderia fasciculata]EGG23875.1 hypothetical protein DFA_06013 [Cavenderia fasciculata]|eukprot:XP_004361726.1 hypothetical protein DFA_06013 [Cavenderia fasciculata]
MDDKPPSISISRTSSTSSINSTSSTKEKRKSGILSLFNKDQKEPKESKESKGKQKDDIKHATSTIVPTISTTNTTTTTSTTSTLNAKELKALEKEKEKQREAEKTRLKEEEERRKEDEKKRLKEEKKRSKELEKEKEKQREQEIQTIKEQVKELKRKQKELKKQQKKDGESTHSHDSTSSMMDDDDDLSISSAHSFNTVVSTIGVGSSTPQKRRKSLDISALANKLLHPHSHGHSSGDSSNQQSNVQQQRRTLGQHRGNSTLSFDYQKNSSSSGGGGGGGGGDTTPRKSATDNDLTYTSGTDDSDFTSTNPTIIETPSLSIDNNNNNSEMTHTKNSTSSNSSLTAHSQSPPNTTYSGIDENSSTQHISDATYALSAEFKKEMERFYGRIEDCQKRGSSYQIERIKELKEALKAESTSPISRHSPKKRSLLQGGDSTSHPQLQQLLQQQHHHHHHRSYSTTAAPQDLKCIMKEIHPSGGEVSPPNYDTNYPPSSNGASGGGGLKSSSDAIMMNSTDSPTTLDKNQQRKGLLRRRWNTHRLSLTLTRNQLNTINNNGNNNNNVISNINSQQQDQSNVNRFIPSFDGTRLKKYLPTVNFKGIGDHLPSFQILPSRNKKKEMDAKDKNQDNQKPTEFKKNIDEILQSFQEPKRPKISVLKEYQERLHLRKPIYSVNQLSTMGSDLETKTLLQHSRIVDDLERCKRINQEIKELNSRLDYACSSIKTIDSDLPFELQLRVDNLKPTVDSNLNDSHKLYEKSKRLEESVQVLRRQSKNSRYAYIHNIFVKLFITGWLVTIYSFFIGKWNKNNVNSDNIDDNNNNNNLEYNSNNSNNNSNNNNNNSNSLEYNSNNNDNQLQSGNNNHSLVLNGASIGHGNDNASSSGINGASGNGSSSLDNLADKKDKKDIMKVAMSNLEAMSRTISLMRENELAAQEH